MVDKPRNISSGNGGDVANAQDEGAEIVRGVDGCCWSAEGMGLADGRLIHNCAIIGCIACSNAPITRTATYWGAQRITSPHGGTFSTHGEATAEEHTYRAENLVGTTYHNRANGDPNGLLNGTREYEHLQRSGPNTTGLLKGSYSKYGD